MRDNGLSGTAVRIGRALVYAAQDPRLLPLLPEGAAGWTERLMLAGGVLKSRHVTWSRNPWFRGYVGLVERWTVPGMALHVGLRKRFFDDETRAALAAGATQVLVVGAGFDTLALRLTAERPEATFVEVDHPATHAVKRAAAERIGALRPNLRLVSADLAAVSLEQVLAGLGAWRRSSVSAVIAEGLLMYLAERDAVRFLEAVRRSTAAGSRLLFSYLEHDAAGRPLVGGLGPFTRWMFDRLGEPLLWSVREGGIRELLEEHGYRLLPPAERYDLRQRYLEPAGLGGMPLGSVERLAVAETAGGGPD